MIQLHVVLDQYGKATLRSITGRRRLAADAAEIADSLVYRLTKSRNQADIDATIEDARFSGIDLHVRRVEL